MIFQISFSIETFTTFLTDVRSNIFMNFIHVMLQIMLIEIKFFTFRARISFYWMDILIVIVQIFFSKETLITRLAFKGLDVVMSLIHMVFQIILMPVRSFAFSAQIFFQWTFFPMSFYHMIFQGRLLDKTLTEPNVPLHLYINIKLNRFCKLILSNQIFNLKNNWENGIERETDDLIYFASYRKLVSKILSIPLIFVLPNLLRPFLNVE